MHRYEIRVMDEDGTTAVIWAAIHLSDYAAIRSARKIARDHLFQVWKGMDCIYGIQDAIVIPLTTPTVPNNL